MNRWVSLVLVAVLFVVGGVLLWNASSVTDEARETAKRFVQQVVGGQWREAYQQFTGALQKKHTWETFSRQVSPLRGSTIMPQVAAFSNWGWSRVEMQLKHPKGQYYEAELFVVKEKSKRKISVFRFRKQDSKEIERAAGKRL